MPTPSDTIELPRRVFSPIAHAYDRPALFLSLFQYRRWHRSLLSRLKLPDQALVLDMATGTGAIASDLLRRPGTRVVGADVTRPMLLQAQRSVAANARLQLVECTAEAPPFADGTFDAITFGYLLRYVSDVPVTLRSLARLLRPGGVLAGLDFAIPSGPAYLAWRLYTDLVLPLGGRLFSRDWQSVGAFLGPNIRDFYRRWPEGRLLEAWREAGLARVQSRRLSLGGGIVTWGEREP